MTKQSITFPELLSPKNLYACKEAVIWNGDRTFDECWRDCTRGDWMLWLAGRLQIDRKKITQVACSCVRLAFPYAGKNVKDIESKLESVEAWAKGQATDEKLVEVRRRLELSVDFFHYDSSFYVYVAAFRAAKCYYSTDSPSIAALAGHDVVDAVASAAAQSATWGYKAYDNRLEARTKMLEQCADLVREPLVDFVRNAVEEKIFAVHPNQLHR